ncbi:hypothetical protein BDV12DRAFT_66543 [Aspergillus spectabilis]
MINSVAHSWSLSRITRLQEFLVQRLVKGNWGDRKLAKTEWLKLGEITTAADLGIWLSMDGYNGYQAAPSEVIAGLQNPRLDQYRRNYFVNYHRLRRRLENENLDQIEKSVDGENFRLSLTR